MENAVGSSGSSKIAELPFDINSNSMDLNNASEKQTVKKCEHFTIRGYVAEVRKKDWKRTWPYSIANYNVTSEEDQPSLPPLRIPEYKQWNCQNCLQEIGAKPSDAADVGTGMFSKNSGFELKGANSNLASLGGSAISSGSHEHLKTATVDRIEIDLNKTVSLDSSRNLSSFSNEGDNEAKATENTITGQENRIKHNDQVNPVLTSSVAVEVDSSMMQETRKVGTASNAVSVESKCNGAVVLNKAGHESHDVDDTGLLVKNQGSMVNNCAKLDQTEKQAPADNEVMELTPAQQTSVVDEIDAEGLVKGYSIGKPCFEIDESEDEVSETGVVSARNGDTNHRDTSSNTLQRRRPRKMRLLTDLLGENGYSKAKHIPKEDLPINQTQDAPRTVSVGPDIEPENVKRSKGQSRKRKLSQDGDRKVSQPRFQNNVVNQIRGGAEMAETNGFPKSKDASVRPSTLNGMKRRCTDPTHKGLSLDKKKKLKMQVEDGHPNVQKEDEKIKEKNISDNENAFSSQGAYTSKKTVVLYDKGKTRQDEDELVRIVPSHDGRLIKNPNVRKYADPSKTRAHIPLQLRDYPAEEEGLGLSLNSYPDGHSFVRKHYAQVKEGQSSVTRQDESYAEGRGKDKDIPEYVMHPCVSFTSVQDSLRGRRRASLDLNSKATPYRVPNLNDRQMFEAERGLLFPVRHSDFLSTTNNEKHAEPQESLVSGKKNGDRGDKKISEQGVIDDVPMDIVELMAKNQYERRLGSNVSSVSSQKQAHASQWMFNTTSQSLDRSSNGVQFSASSSSRSNSNNNVKWNADTVAQGSKHYANMQAIGVCNTRPFPRQGEEDASHWHSRTPNSMPLRCNIPQKCTTRPMNMDVPSHNHLQKGNSYLNLNVPIRDSCSKSFPAENYGRTRTEYPQPSNHNRIDLNQSPMGPLDLNSKETISAMQLLSLMHAGMRSGPSFNLEAKFFTRTSRPQAGCSCEFSLPQSMINKTSSTVMLPQSSYLGMHCHSERSNGYFQSFPAAEASTSMQRKVTGSSNSMMLPLRSGFEMLGSSGSALNLKRVSEFEICAVNNDPADFTVPDPNNEYMIRPNDLNFGDTVPLKSRSRNASHSGGRGRNKNKNT